MFYASFIWQFQILLLPLHQIKETNIINHLNRAATVKRQNHYEDF